MSDLNLDSAEASELHATMIREKYFLRKIYEENYSFFKEWQQRCPAGQNIELGSGGGFIKEYIPNVLASDVLPLSTVDLAFSATDLPFPNQTLSSIMMINVLHHIQDVETFFAESLRTLLPGGRIIMIEPANTLFSNFIYKNFHHEPFEPKQESWALPAGGRMSSANDALPWIIFFRDREKFKAKYPQFEIELCQNFMPFRYILSGGVSRGQFLPSWMYGLVKNFEWLISPGDDLWGLFMKVVVKKK